MKDEEISMRVGRSGGEGPAATVHCSFHVSALVLGLRSDGASKSACEAFCGDRVACKNACERDGWDEHEKKREGDGSDAKKRVGCGPTRVSAEPAYWWRKRRRNVRDTDRNTTKQPPKVPLKSKEAIAKAAASSSKGKKKKWSKGKSKEKVNNLVLFDKVSGN